MSLPDTIVHGVLAPGRHLSKPVHLEGVTCEPPLWRKGRRLSQIRRLRDALVCRRDGLERRRLATDTALAWTRSGNQRFAEPTSADRLSVDWLWMLPETGQTHSAGLKGTTCPSSPEARAFAILPAIASAAGLRASELWWM